MSVLNTTALKDTIAIITKKWIHCDNVHASLVPRFSFGDQANIILYAYTIL